MATPTVKSVIMSDDFLPTLSPRCPNMSAARGLEKYIAVYEKRESAKEITGGKAEKNTRGHTVDAAIPAIITSYHSMNVPKNVAETAVFWNFIPEELMSEGDALVNLSFSRT